MPATERVIHVLSSLGHGGAETFTVQLAIWQSNNGLKPCIAYVNSAATLGIDSAFENSLANTLSQAGIPVYCLDSGSSKGYWRKRLKNLRQAITNENPDILHIHLGRGLMLMFLGRIRIPAVMTIHNVRVGFPPRLFKLFQKLPVEYVAVSTAVGKIFTPFISQKIHVVFNGLDFSKFTPRQSDQQSDVIKVLSVGTARAQKNYALLIETAKIMKSLDAGNVQWVMQVAGGGPLYDQLLQQSHQENVSDVLKFLGPRTDVPELLTQSDIFAMSSDYEGMPIAMLEAMYCGLAVATTDFAGVSDLVTNNETALISPVGNARALATHLLKLINSPDTRAGISSAGQQHTQAFSIDVVGNNYLTEYRKVAQKYG